MTDDGLNAAFDLDDPTDKHDLENIFRLVNKILVSKERPDEANLVNASISSVKVEL